MWVSLWTNVFSLLLNKTSICVILTHCLVAVFRGLLHTDGSAFRARFMPFFMIHLSPFVLSQNSIRTFSAALYQNVLVSNVKGFFFFVNVRKWTAAAYWWRSTADSWIHLKPKLHIVSMSVPPLENYACSSPTWPQGCAALSFPFSPADCEANYLLRSKTHDWIQAPDPGSIPPPPNTPLPHLVLSSGD